MNPRMLQNEKAGFLPGNSARENRRFTLIELLLVVAIIAVLAGMLMPALSAARRRALDISCTSNLKQVGLHFNAYALDYKDIIVPNWAQNRNDPIKNPLGIRHWATHLIRAGYVKRHPDHPEEDYLAEYQALACPAQLMDVDPADLKEYSVGWTYGSCPRYLVNKTNTAPLLLKLDQWYKAYERWPQKNSATIIAIDSVRNKPGDKVDRYQNSEGCGEGKDSLIHLRHGNNVANACFADGHVGTVSRMQLMINVGSSAPNSWFFGGQIATYNLNRITTAVLNRNF